MGAALVSEGLTTEHPRKGLGRVHCAHARGCHGAMVLVLQWLPGHYRSQAKVACLDAVGSCLGGTDSRDEYGDIRPWPPGERLTIGLTLLKETQSRPRGEADAASVERRREARLRTLAVHARRRVLCKYVCGAKTRVANAVHRHEHLRRQSEVFELGDLNSALLLDTAVM